MHDQFINDRNQDLAKRKDTGCFEVFSDRTVMPSTPARVNGINVSFGINALISFGMVDWIFTPQPQIRAGLENGGLRILQRGLGCGLNPKRVRVEP